MKTFFLATATALCLVATASAQSPVEKALTGTWKCAAEADGTAVSSSTIYLAGGKQTFDVDVKVAQAGLEFTGSGTGDWKVQPDGKLAETITALTVKTAKMQGQETPAAGVQDMIAAMIVGQTSTSSVELKDGGMILVDQNGTTNTCKR